VKGFHARPKDLVKLFFCLQGSRKYIPPPVFFFVECVALITLHPVSWSLSLPSKFCDAGLSSSVLSSVPSESRPGLSKDETLHLIRTTRAVVGDWRSTLPGSPRRCFPTTFFFPIASLTPPVGLIPLLFGRDLGAVFTSRPRFKRPS